MALVASLSGLLASLAPPWVDRTPSPTDHVVSRGYFLVGATPTPLDRARPENLQLDWARLVVTWASLCLAVWVVDGTARQTTAESCSFLRSRSAGAFAAQHRVGIAVACALLLPVPIPLGLLLALLVFAGGVGSGSVGVGVGGPVMVLQVLALTGALAVCAYTALTVLLRSVLHLDVPWCPSNHRPTP
jgi:hypothetical protein